MLKGWVAAAIIATAVASAPVSGTVGADTLETETAVVVETERAIPDDSNFEISMEEVEEEIDLSELSLDE